MKKERNIFMTTQSDLSTSIKILKKEIHDQRAEEIAAYVFKERKEKK